MAIVKGMAMPSTLRHRSWHSKTKSTVAIEAVEVFPSKSRGNGRASSLSKSKRKTTESLLREALKKNLLASAKRVSEREGIFFLQFRLYSGEFLLGKSHVSRAIYLLFFFSFFYLFMLSASRQMV